MGETGNYEGEDSVMVLTRGENDSSSSDSKSHSEVDLPAFREQIASGNEAAVTLWHSAVFHGVADLIGECALAVAQWIQGGALKVTGLDDEVLLCIVRCHARKSCCLVVQICW